MTKKYKSNLIYILKKMLQFILSMFLLSIIVFYISRLVPGNPLKAYFGESSEKMSIVEKEAAIEMVGLNSPIYIQYKKWITEVFKGNYGISFKYKQDVIIVLKDFYINTIILGGLSYILTFLLALPIGIFCCLNEDKVIDKIICKIGTIISCIPPFWLSLILILIFSVNTQVLPSSGAYSIGQSNNMLNRIYHLILPVSVLVLSHLWYYAYIVRNKLLEEVRQQYIFLSKMKGLNKNQIVFKHCLKNIMPSYITIMAISIPHILSGTYIIENVFSYPGLGTLCFESAKYHDYNMLLIISLITGAIVIIANIIAQIISNIIDPRVKNHRGEVI